LERSVDIVKELEKMKYKYRIVQKGNGKYAVQYKLTGFLNMIFDSWSIMYSDLDSIKDAENNIKRELDYENSKLITKVMKNYPDYI
jgi:hypothetical protein